MEITVYYTPDIRIPCLTVLRQETVALISMCTPTEVDYEEWLMQKIG